MGKLLVVGHRGAMGLAPENSLESINAALDAGVDIVEFDLHTTNDGVPVLSHNPFLRSATGRQFLNRLSFLEARKLKPSLTRFDEALTRIGHRALKMVEVKPGVAMTPIAEIIKKHIDKGYKPEEFFIASRDFKVLKEAKSLLPNIPLVVIERYFGTRASYRLHKLKAEYASMQRRVLWFGFIKAVAKNYKLFSYVMNDPKKAHKWAKYGLYGAITDYPDRFKG